MKKTWVLVGVMAALAAAMLVWVFMRGDAGREGRTAAVRQAAAPAPAEVVGPFHVGVSALDVEENERAGRLFTDLSARIPDEPAVWANLGVARLRVGDLAGAREALERASGLAPDNEQVTLALAIVDEYQGDFEGAIRRLRSIADPDPAALHRLAELLGRTGRDADLREQLAVYDRIVERAPGNMVAVFSRARLLARLEDGEGLSAALRQLEQHQDAWGPDAIEQFRSAVEAAASSNFRNAATHLAFLQNLNLATPAYQAALADLGVSGGSIGQPVREFLRYGNPGVAVAEPDPGLRYDLTPETPREEPVLWYGMLELGTNSGVRTVIRTGGSLQVKDGARLEVGAAGARTGPRSVCAADIDGDFRIDFALAGERGLQLWMQDENGGFRVHEPAEEVRAAFQVPVHSVWAIDFEADGDLDMVVSGAGAAPRLFRNNGDGSYTPMDAFEAFPEIRELVWADFDADGDGDLALLDEQGGVLVSWNHRSGAYAPPVRVGQGTAVAIAWGDVSAVGRMCLLALDEQGSIREARFDRTEDVWRERELARWPDPPALRDAWEEVRASLAVADLDNNGAVDLVASAGSAAVIWLNAGGGSFRRLEDAPPLFVSSVVDADGDGLPDLAGLAQDGAAVAHGRGTRDYHWQTIATRTLSTVADGRLNSFGLGGHIEVRAGPLLSIMPITSPRTHFGLGEQTGIGVARIVWPNGVGQVEFDLAADTHVTAVQRLKGSCPWVFVRGDDGFHFVKDFIWRSPLGMRINSQDTAGVEQTEDWILIPGRLMAAHEGAYEVRITAELWETHFFDHISLMVVDHPGDVVVHVDERFVPTRQPKLEVIAASPERPFAGITTESGRDVTEILAKTDGRYVDDFRLGRFQGIAEDHWVEFELPPEAEGSLLLIGEGWIYPTDSSLNVAVSQGSHPPPRGLSLEVRTSEGDWLPASDDLGFPAGKNKTVVIPLPEAEVNAGRRRFRLRTNLEVYWDRIAWAEARPDAPLRTARAETLAAELRHRGFSRVDPPHRRRPDIPEYDHLVGIGPRWLDLEGYYTRFGDVAELLERVDDRYVIMNAGDEFILRFAEILVPPAGWKRDFVLIGDGWVKDGDFNTARSRTVHPLPTHASSDYGGPPGPLEADPVYLRHREDWQRFHTRLVTPDLFQRGMMKGLGKGDVR